jgi:murein L,D-transpeptidase YafK
MLAQMRAQMRARMALRTRSLATRLQRALRGFRGCLIALSGTLMCLLMLHPAQALTIELKDVAPDRIERQRAFAMGNLPLPGTPDIANLEQRLAAKQLKAGDQLFIRIFKAESELEIWMKRGGKFVLLDIYPMCHWSGTVGPKVNEGDKQSPEGFYTVGRKQLHLFGRHPRSLDLGFPNALDQALNRTGSFILIHGGCSSVGCFAMTNTVTAEVYDLTEKALKAGQDRVHVHVFPFRMTEANLAGYQNNPWIGFWRNLKQGYDAFEQTRLPPRVGICGKNYTVLRATPGEAGDSGPLAPCGDSRAATPQASFPSTAPTLNPSTLNPPTANPVSTEQPPAASNQRSQLLPRRQPTSAPTPLAAQLSASAGQSSLQLQSQMSPSQRAAYQQHPVQQSQNQPNRRELPPPPFRLGASLGQMPVPRSNLPREPAGRAASAKPTCDLARPSCRRYSSLQSRLAATTAKLRPIKTARAR